MSRLAAMVPDVYAVRLVLGHRGQAHIGCQTHLEVAGRTAVRHWIELVEETLT
jgi:hypothetical protein